MLRRPVRRLCASDSQRTPLPLCQSPLPPWGAGPGGGGGGRPQVSRARLSLLQRFLTLVECPPPPPTPAAAQAPERKRLLLPVQVQGVAQACMPCMRATPNGPSCHCPASWALCTCALLRVMRPPPCFAISQSLILHLALLRWRLALRPLHNSPRPRNLSRTRCLCEWAVAVLICHGALGWRGRAVHAGAGPTREGPRQVVVRWEFFWGRGGMRLCMARKTVPLCALPQLHGPASRRQACGSHRRAYRMGGRGGGGGGEPAHGAAHLSLREHGHPLTRPKRQPDALAGRPPCPPTRTLPLPLPLQVLQM